MHIIGLNKFHERLKLFHKGLDQFHMGLKLFHVRLRGAQTIPCRAQTISWGAQTISQGAQTIFRFKKNQAALNKCHAGLNKFHAVWIFPWLPLFWWFWCWSLKIVWAPREIFLRCLSCSCDVTKVGGLLCNTSPLWKDGDDYIEDDNDVGDRDDENDADNCDHNVVTTIMVTIIMVAKIMVTMMMVVEMMTETRITMMTMNSLLHFTLFCWKSCLFFAIYAVLSQNRFVAIYAQLCGENFSQK